LSYKEFCNSLDFFGRSRWGLPEGIFELQQNKAELVPPYPIAIKTRLVYLKQTRRVLNLYKFQKNY